MQSRRDLVEMMAGEVRAVVDVKDVGHTADRPGGIGLAPNGVTQREAGVQHRRGADERQGAGHRARVVVEDDGQPWAHWLAGLIENENVQHGVVGLPDRVGRFGAVPMDQLIAVAKCCRPVQRQADHCRVELGEDRMHRAVGWHRPAFSLGDFGNPAVDQGSGRARLLQPHTLDQHDEIGRQPVDAGIAANAAGQPCKAVASITRQPTLDRSDRNTGIARGARQRSISLQVRPEHGEAGHGLAVLRLAQLGKRRRRVALVLHTGLLARLAAAHKQCPQGDRSADGRLAPGG